MKYIENIPENGKKRVVVAGGGFAGITLIKELASCNDLQIVLIDKNNYHQFPPLLYQVAMAGLEPSAVAFPLRKLLQGKKDMHFRMATVTGVDPLNNELLTTTGKIRYDYLVLATGANTHYFGMKEVAQKAIPMKSLEEAIYLRNALLMNLEEALNYKDPALAEPLLTICIAGGGPTGVELAGALCEMKKHILPRDYPEIDFNAMKIFLLEAGNRLLSNLSEKSSQRALHYLQDMGVNVWLNAQVKNYDGFTVTLNDNRQIVSRTMIWTAGVVPEKIEGLGSEAWSPRGRLITDEYGRVKGFSNIFSAGDLCMSPTGRYPSGHPQVAPVAIQQAKVIASNIKNSLKGKPLQPFIYRDKGSMATIGRHRAVAELRFMKLYGTGAWFLWGIVHLFSIIGVKNKVAVFLDWMIHYFSYDQSLRLLIGKKRTTYL